MSSPPLPPEELERLVVEFVNRPDYHPVKPAVIAKRLKLDDEQKRQLKKLIKRLVKRGRIVYGSNHLVGPANTASRALVTGVFHRVDRGFGFVRPLGTTPEMGRTADLFIPANKCGDAANGDTVLVKISPNRRGREEGEGRENKNGKQRGEIVEIIERQTRNFVGTYYETPDAGYVTVDGGLFADPIFVGDPGAKRARVEDKVVIEMVRFPTHAAPGEGVIIEVLGPRGQPGVDTLTIIREFGLSDAFPESVLEAARRQADKFDENKLTRRRDLTGETTITIDPIDARDFDDAISLTRIENGHWLLGVHIADVAHFVRPNTPLDREARERATSVYLPDRVLPMLPEVISNNLASLQPGRVRYTKTAMLEFTPDGVRVHAEVFSGAIRSRRRFTYEEVDDFLANPAAWKPKIDVDVHRLLRDMHELAMILRRRRFDRGALELTMPEVKIELNGEGAVSGARVVENTVSHQIIEEFMLSANEAVATHLESLDISFLRRVHDSPDPRKLKMLTEFIHEMGIPCESLESRFEIKRLLEDLHGRPEERALNYAILRSFQKAIYSPREEGHFALASDCYCHFTSPIRRYPDLAVHRIINALERGKKPVEDLDRLTVLGQHCSDREQRAEKAERELIKIKLLTCMSTRIGEEMDALVTGVERFGLFAQGIDIPAEGLVHVRSLPDDYFDYDPKARTLTGRRRGGQFRLGDLVRVRVNNVDVDSRELDFGLIEKLTSHEGFRRLPKKPTRKPKRDFGGKKRARKKPGKKKSAAGKPQAKKRSSRKK